jgi:glutamate synthase (NADPH/NADH) small chain
MYPTLFRVSPAHEEASGRGADVRTFSASTIAFEGGADGRVRAVRVVEVEPSRRHAVSGTERTFPAELVLLALGFSGPESDGPIVDQLRLRIDDRGNFARDDAYAAGDGIFVAGDAGRGQSLIVWAIAEGRAAAAAVDRYLTGSTTLPAPVTPTDRPISV